MNDLFSRGPAFNSARASAGGGYGSWTGVNTTRQDRFQARAQRRWGDVTYWSMPAPVLWLEDPFVLSPFDDILFVEPAFVDIWA